MGFLHCGLETDEDVCQWHPHPPALQPDCTFEGQDQDETHDDQGHTGLTIHDQTRHELVQPDGTPPTSNPDRVTSLIFCWHPDSSLQKAKTH